MQSFVRDRRSIDWMETGSSGWLVCMRFWSGERRFDGVRSESDMGIWVRSGSVKWLVCVRIWEGCYRVRNGSDRWLTWAIGWFAEGEGVRGVGCFVCRSRKSNTGWNGWSTIKGAGLVFKMNKSTMLHVFMKREVSRILMLLEGIPEMISSRLCFSRIDSALRASGVRWDLM